jgi:hypothetical protein
MGPRGRRRGLLAALLLVQPLLPAAAEQDRMALGAAEVHLPGLAIGRTYSTMHLAQAPLVVQNPSDDTVRVHVRVVVPARYELRPGARPVPDRGWIQLDCDWLVVPPRSVRHADVLLSLPYDPDLAGHLYQVDLQSDLVSPSGTSAALARRHRLLFKVEMDYRDDTEIDFASRNMSPGQHLL